MKIYTKDELYKLDAVEIYKMILDGNVIQRFPSGFWREEDAKDNAAKCIKYLIEERLKYNEKDLKEKLSVSLFNRNKLSGMLQTCFKNSPYEAINNSYPDKYKEWEFKCVPMGYWEIKENRIKATKWLIENKLKLSDEQLKEQLSTKLFTKHGLSGMIQCDTFLDEKSRHINLKIS